MPRRKTMHEHLMNVEGHFLDRVIPIPIVPRIPIITIRDEGDDRPSKRTLRGHPSSEGSSEEYKPIPTCYTRVPEHRETIPQRISNPVPPFESRNLQPITLLREPRQTFETQNKPRPMATQQGLWQSHRPSLLPAYRTFESQRPQPVFPTQNKPISTQQGLLTWQTHSLHPAFLIPEGVILYKPQNNPQPQERLISLPAPAPEYISLESLAVLQNAPPTPEFVSLESLAVLQSGQPTTFDWQNDKQESVVKPLRPILPEEQECQPTVTCHWNPENTLKITEIKSSSDEEIKNKLQPLAERETGIGMQDDFQKDCGNELLDVDENAARIMQDSESEQGTRDNNNFSKETSLPKIGCCWTVRTELSSNQEEINEAGMKQSQTSGEKDQEDISSEKENVINGTLSQTDNDKRSPKLAALELLNHWSKEISEQGLITCKYRNCGRSFPKNKILSHLLYCQAGSTDNELCFRKRVQLSADEAVQAKVDLSNTSENSRTALGASACENNPTAQSVSASVNTPTAPSINAKENTKPAASIPPRGRPRKIGTAPSVSARENTRTTTEEEAFQPSWKWGKPRFSYSRKPFQNATAVQPELDSALKPTEVANRDDVRLRLRSFKRSIQQNTLNELVISKNKSQVVTMKENLPIICTVSGSFKNLVKLPNDISSSVDSIARPKHHPIRRMEEQDHEAGDKVDLPVSRKTGVESTLDLEVYDSEASLSAHSEVESDGEITDTGATLPIVVKEEEIEDMEIDDAQVIIPDLGLDGTCFDLNSCDVKREEQSSENEVNCIETSPAPIIPKIEHEWSASSEELQEEQVPSCRPGKNFVTCNEIKVIEHCEADHVQNESCGRDRMLVKDSNGCEYVCTQTEPSVHLVSESENHEEPSWKRDQPHFTYSRKSSQHSTTLCQDQCSASEKSVKDILSTRQETCKRSVQQNTLDVHIKTEEVNLVNVEEHFSIKHQTGNS